MKFSILTASLRDLGSLRKVELACFPKDAWPLLDLIAVLTWPDVVRLKALLPDSQMIGFIAGNPRPSEKTAWIATLGVLPEYQRQGIGRALLRACEAKLAEERLKLCVRVSNESAIRLYQQEGYVAIDTWSKYYNDQENALLMEKIRQDQRLDPP